MKNACDFLRYQSLFDELLLNYLARTIVINIEIFLSQLISAYSKLANIIMLLSLNDIDERRVIKSLLNLSKYYLEV